MSLTPLARLGWDAGWDATLAALPAAEGRPVRVIEQHRSSFRVDDGEQARDARLLPALLKKLGRDEETLCVGDWALYRDDGDWLTALLPRRSGLEREREDGRKQRLVANVDTALLVMGLDGDYKPERLARYRVMALAGGVQPVILLSKADKVADAESQRREIEALAGTDTAVLLIDPRQPDTVAQLSPWLGPGRTLVLLGSSGVGKSTLMNTLLGEAVQRTGATQSHDDLGRHTTTARFLRRLPGDACLIDTPGLRELKLNSEQTRLADDFADVQALLGQCRFRDCQHRREPGCALTASLPMARIESWRTSNSASSGSPHRKSRR